MPTATWAHSGGDFLTTRVSALSSVSSVGSASPAWDAAGATWIATDNENGDTGTVSMAGDGGSGPDTSFALIRILMQLEDDSSINPADACNTIRLTFDYDITNGPMGTATAESEIDSSLVNPGGIIGPGTTSGTYDETVDGTTFGLPTMGDVFFFWGDPGGFTSFGVLAYSCIYTAGTFSVHNRRFAISNFRVIISYGAVVVPIVTDVSPTHEDARGGNVVTITGTGFTGATSVLFGSTPATSFTVDSDTQISAIAPAHAVGAVTVSVA